jgi:hypothetical protein
MDVTFAEIMTAAIITAGIVIDHVIAHALWPELIVR